MVNGRIGWVLLAALAAVSAVLIAGCGGSGEETANANPALTKAELIKQGDAICKELVEQREQQFEKFGKQRGFTLQTATNKQLEELVTEVAIPTLKQQTAKFNALGAPEGDEAQVEEIVAGWEAATKKIESNPGLAIEEDPLDDADALAKAYGFKFCGLK